MNLARGKRLTSIKGGDNMTVIEVLSLLNLLAVVIFGIIQIIKK